MNSTGLCEDIDECLFKSPCKEREFCENTVGSYTCYECDPACGTTCDGLGPNRCKGECNSGFTRVYKPTNPDEYIKCEDIDECESNPCGGQLRCVNNYGGYDCIGKFNFYISPLFYFYSFSSLSLSASFLYLTLKRVEN